MPRINTQVLQALTTSNATPATGISETYKFRPRKGHDILTYSIHAGTMAGGGGGSISGTYVLEASVPDMAAWITVPDGTITDTETSGTFVPGKALDLRWNCTVAGDDVVVRIG